MSRTSPLAVGVFALTALLVIATFGTIKSANAAVKQNGRFVFSSYTKNYDPVNLLLYGGQRNQPDACVNLNRNSVARTPACWRFINSASWRKRRMHVLICNGRDTLTFRGNAKQVNPSSQSTSLKCATQYHNRQWDDSLVNESPKDGEFSVGTIYHEKRCELPGRPGNQNCYGSGSHRIDFDWETAEVAEWLQVLKSTEGESRFCVFPDWRVLPGQRPGKHRGFYNNGRITRVSIQQVNDSEAPNKRCAGA